MDDEKPVIEAVPEAMGTEPETSVEVPKPAVKKVRKAAKKAPKKKKAKKAKR